MTIYWSQTDDIKQEDAVILQINTDYNKMYTYGLPVVFNYWKQVAFSFGWTTPIWLLY